MGTCLYVNRHTERDSPLEQDDQVFRTSVSSAGRQYSAENLSNFESPVIYPRAVISLNSSLEVTSRRLPTSRWSRPSRSSRRHSVPTVIFMDAIMAARKESVSKGSPVLSLRWEVSSTLSYFPLAMTQVLSTLYIGTYDNAINEEDLVRNGITHILCLIGNQSRVDWVNHKQYTMNDYGKTDIKDVLNDVYDFMIDGQKGNNKLLVHCQSGQNRSAVVIISFLMKNDKKTLYRAHRELTKVRPIVQVNVRYAKQLLELEEELFGKTSLPSDWMERKFDKIAEEVSYKYQDLDTPHHATLIAQKDAQGEN